MKPLERIFFQACVMNIRLLLPSGCIVGGVLSVRDIINRLCYLGFSEKQLWYYLDKWDNKGFYNWGVTQDLGWFEVKNLVGEYKVMYDKILEAGVRYGGN